MDNIEQRANKVEAQIVEKLGLSSEGYLEMWYELGCKYAEDLFTSWALAGPALNRAVDIYIKSGLFWYFWAKTWVRACEMMLNKGTVGEALLKSYLRQMPAPGRALHREIVRHSKGTSKKETRKYYEKVQP